MDILLDIHIPEGKRIIELDSDERQNIIETLNSSEVLKDNFLRK
jgi:hypothetical protein